MIAGIAAAGAATTVTGGNGGRNRDRGDWNDRRGGYNRGDRDRGGYNRDRGDRDWRD